MFIWLQSPEQEEKKEESTITTPSSGTASHYVSDWNKQTKQQQTKKEHIFFYNTVGIFLQPKLQTCDTWHQKENPEPKENCLTLALRAWLCYMPAHPQA